MAIIVTGASGFLGKKLLKRLITIGKKVVAIDLSQPKNDFYSHPNIQWVLCDMVKDSIDLESLGHIEAVIHLAGATLGAGKNEHLFLTINETTTVKLMQALDKRCNKFILASSQVVYGDIDSLSVSENFPVSANHSAYACSKLNTENWMRWFHSKNGGSYIFLRFCGFIDGKGIVDYIIDQAIENQPIDLLSKGEVSRDYLPSENGIDAIMKTLKYDLGDGVLEINIGSGQSISSKELASIICSEINSTSEINLLEEPAPQSNFVHAIGLAKELLDFRPNNLIDSVKDYAKERKKLKVKL